MLFVLLFLFAHSAADSRVPFICTSSHILSSIERVCDGRIDCDDGSDETAAMCSRIICPGEYFKCYYGACVLRRQKCDGIRDCADGSDERNCGRRANSCAANEFYCDAEPHCIPAALICDGVRDCVDGADEATDMCRRQLCPFGTYRCHFGGCIAAEQQCDGFRDCFDGSDETDVLCVTLQCAACAKSAECPPLFGREEARVRFECEWGGRRVSCAEHILPGTKVTHSCREYFAPAEALHEHNDWNVCQADGTWLRDALRCKPECGRTSAAIPLIFNGWQAPSQLPWHASLLEAADGGSIEYLCGATLVSEAAVITAAHCVFNAAAESLRIVLGATTSKLEDSPAMQHALKAKRIVLHPLYLDRFGNYGSDIALVEFGLRVELSEHVLPICLDRSATALDRHSIGVVVGLGLTEHFEYSEKLLLTTAPVVEYSKCAAFTSFDFRKYISFTTFCAGWANGTSVCNGDSGAGLIFPMDDASGRWSLQGIVSLSPRKLSTAFCDPFQYAIFTKVGIYVDWIERQLDGINEPTAHRNRRVNHFH